MSIFFNVILTYTFFVYNSSEDRSDGWWYEHTTCSASPSKTSGSWVGVDSSASTLCHFFHQSTHNGRFFVYSYIFPPFFGSSIVEFCYTFLYGVYYFIGHPDRTLFGSVLLVLVSKYAYPFGEFIER